LGIPFKYSIEPPSNYYSPTLYSLYAVYITATQISYCNYPISKMCCPIMSVIFEKVLYLIPLKMPPKRYGRFRAYHAYITLGDYQTVRSPYPPSPHPDDAW